MEVASLAELGADTRDVYAWVNEQTKDSDNKKKIEVILPQLHVLSQELSGTLQQRLENFPSFSNHVQLLAIKSQTLNQSLQMLSDTVVPESTGDANPALIQLHEAKARMVQCIDALQESASWKQHSRLVAQILSDSNAEPPLDTLATHLTAMNHSLRILDSMPGASERQHTMTQYSSQVETMVLPHIQAALSEPILNTDALNTFLSVFQCLGRTEVAINTYATARPAPIHRMWFALVTGPPRLDLASFYTDTQQFLSREWASIELLFGPKAAPHVWIALLEATLKPCSLSSHLTLDNVTNYFQLSLRFAHQVILQNAWDLDAIGIIFNSVFEGYFTLFETFTDAETNALKPKALDLLPEVDRDFADQLEDSVAQLWSLVEERSQFGISFAFGALLPATITSMLTILTEFETELIKSREKLEEIVEQGSSMDWGAFHLALGLVKSTGSIQLQAQTMQTRLTLRFQDPLSAWCSPESDENANLEFSLHDCSELSTLPRALIKYWWSKEPARFKEFVALRQSIAQKPVFGRLFKQWTSTVQHLMYESVLGPIQHNLQPLATMDTWIQAAEDQALPSFSTLPKEYITVVADILLSLLPQLELFAETSGLASAMAASNDMELLSDVVWTKLATQLHIEIDHAVDVNAENFVDRWTMTFASGTMALLALNIFKIPRFSTLGAEQLACDLGYFENVLKALGLTMHPILLHVRHSMQRQPCSCTSLDDRTKSRLDSLISFT